EEEMFMMSKDSEKEGSDPEIVNFEVEQPLNSKETTELSSTVPETSGESIAPEPINTENIEPQEEEDLSNYSLARDRQRRDITPLAKYCQIDYVSVSLN
ncbi:unnamed protein product, partial [Citrullus colocynthis]